MDPRAWRAIRALRYLDVEFMPPQVGRTLVERMHVARLQIDDTREHLAYVERTDPTAAAQIDSELVQMYRNDPRLPDAICVFGTP